MEQVLIQGYPHLKGEGISFKDEPFYDLVIGDKITKIGDGRNNGTYRTLEVTPFMTYVGSIELEDGTVDPKYYAFLLPEQGVIGTKEPVYCLISDVGVMEDGIGYVGRKNFQIMNFYCYVAEFHKVIDEVSCAVRIASM